MSQLAEDLHRHGFIISFFIPNQNKIMIAASNSTIIFLIPGLRMLTIIRHTLEDQAGEKCIFHRFENLS